jgi:Holliday junction resolvase RusA-like endonuclease
MRVKFTIMGPPKGKGRPRFQRIGNYTKVSTPPDTVNYENLVKIEYEMQCDRYYFDTKELGIKITSYYPIAKSTSKKKKEKMLNGEINPTKKPDCDNVLKIIADSLNQIAYHDDAQIIEATIVKKFAEVPKTEVEIYDLEDPDTVYEKQQ